MSVKNITATAYLERAAAIISAPSISLRIFAKPTGTAFNSRCLMDIGVHNDNEQRTACLLLGNDDPGPTIVIGAVEGGSGNYSEAQSGGSFGTGTWKLAAADFVSTTSRKARLNGANEGTNTDSRTPSTPNRSRIGVTVQASLPADVCLLAEASWWDSDSFAGTDWADLDAKLVALENPLNISAEVGEPWSGKLVAYHTLEDLTDGLIDQTGNGHDLTAVGTVAADGDHPAIDPAGSVPTISIDQSAPAIGEHGDTLQLSASVTGGPAPTVVWESSNTGVATVNSSTGLVTSVGDGSTTITATATNTEGEDDDSVVLSVSHPQFQYQVFRFGGSDWELHQDWTDDSDINAAGYPAGTTLARVRARDSVATSAVSEWEEYEVELVSSGVSPSAAALTLAGATPTLTFTLSPAAATLALTGQTPTVTATDHVTVSPAAATLAVSGATPGLDLALNPAAAALALSGETPTVSATGHLTVVPSAASLALSGETPSLDTAIAPSAGALILAGETPSVEVSANISVEPSTAALALAGATPTLDLALSPGSAALVLTSETPTVSATANVSVEPGAGTLTLAGATPALDTGVSPAAAALTLAPETSTVGVTDNVTVEPIAAALSLSGQTPALDIGIFPSTAGLELTPETPTIDVSAGLVVSPTVAALALAASTPSLDLALSPATASLTLAAVSPSLDLEISPAPGALSLTGEIPTVQTTDHVSVAPATGVLVLSGATPSVDISANVTVQPVAAGLLLTGATPFVSTGIAEYQWEIMPAGSDEWELLEDWTAAVTFNVPDYPFGTTGLRVRARNPADYDDISEWVEVEVDRTGVPSSTGIPLDIVAFQVRIATRATFAPAFSTTATMAPRFARSRTFRVKV